MWISDTVWIQSMQKDRGIICPWIRYKIIWLVKAGKTGRPSFSVVCNPFISLIGIINSARLPSIGVARVDVFSELPG